MADAKTKAPVVTGELMSIPLANLIPTPDNVRIVKATDAKVKDLAESIKTLGVLQPVVARPHPTKPGKYDLRAGARRHMAAGLAGLAVIPAIVSEMDELTAKVVTVTENMERQDLTPWEESRGVRQMLDAGLSAEDVAAKLGKSVSFVFRRASLTRLAPCWQKAAGEEFRSWPAAYWERLAALPIDVQTQVHKEADLDPSYIDSVKDLESEIVRYTHELVQAPWPIEDPGVVTGCLACVECQKRSGVTPGLFDIPENATAEVIRKKDRCLDSACWERKAEAWRMRRKIELEREHGKVLLVGHGKGMVEEWKIEKAKPGAKGAVCCLDANGNSFWGKTRAEERSSEPRKTESGGESKAETGDDAMREELAVSFATGHLALVLAADVCRAKRPAALEPLFHELTACSLAVMQCHRSAQGHGSYYAREILACRLGIAKESKYGHDSLDAFELWKQFSPEAIGERIIALGYFDFKLTADEHESGPKIPDAIREKAAKSFAIPQSFLDGHLRADLYRIVKGLGVAVELSATKEEIVKAAMGAKLPAGTLTPELAKAFGVKHSKPKVSAKPAKAAKKDKG